MPPLLMLALANSRVAPLLTVACPVPSGFGELVMRTVPVLIVVTPVRGLLPVTASVPLPCLISAPVPDPRTEVKVSVVEGAVRNVPPAAVKVREVENEAVVESVPPVETVTPVDVAPKASRSASSVAGEEIVHLPL